MTNRSISKLFIAAIVLAPGAPASAAPGGAGYDGDWSVVATTETGTCQGPYRYPIVIRGGVIDEAGGQSVEASGRAAPDGRVSGTIRNGLANVSVTGRLRGANGGGRWTLTGLGDCGGRWTASKAR